MPQSAFLRPHSRIRICPEEKLKKKKKEEAYILPLDRFGAI
jgi:hypothetical protein